MSQAFDFSTSEILNWELEQIQTALDNQEIGISEHAADAAAEDNLSLLNLLEAILVGTPTTKDLPNNALGRVAGINFEHITSDKRFYRVKVAWINEYLGFVPE